MDCNPFALGDDASSDFQAHSTLSSSEMMVKASDVKGLQLHLLLKPLFPVPFDMTLITKGHGFPTDLDPDVNTVTLPAIEDGSHVLGAPSRDTRALARIRPESESRGEHRGIGKSACLLLC